MKYNGPLPQALQKMAQVQSKQARVPDGPQVDIRFTLCGYTLNPPIAAIHDMQAISLYTTLVAGNPSSIALLGAFRMTIMAYLAEDQQLGNSGPQGNRGDVVWINANTSGGLSISSKAPAKPEPKRIIS